MKLVNTSVKRPVGVIMIVLAIIAMGIISVRNLAIDLFPEIDLPVAVVATNYQDASPQEVEKLVSEPIEGSVSSIEGVDTIQSQSQSGSSLVVLMFENGTNLDNALLDVRESVDQVKAMLPEGAAEPSVLRFNPNQMPIMWVGLTGSDTTQLQSVAEDTVQPYFERQSGVASVSLEGGQERVIHLELNQTKMNQYGVTTNLIMQSLNGANQSASAGTVQKGDQDLQVRIDGDFESVDDIAQTIIQTPQGGQVRVEDVTTVKDTVQDNGTTLVNGESAVVLSVLKQSDGNTVDVSNNILSAVDDLQSDLPSDVELDVVVDTSEFIKQSIDSVIQNMIYGGIFALLVLLLFLKSVRATIVIGLSIPIAIISTFVLLYFTGETLNVLTMGGLALGIGMMVDSSIVILENIVSYRQRGYNIIEASKKGASELAPAVIASTTTTLVVFLPIVFVEGMASELFTPLALTVSFALIASLAVSVTLIPMLSSKLLTKAMSESGRRYWFDRFLNKIIQGYKRVLEKALKLRKTTIAITIAAIIGSLALIPFIGTAFIPEGDQGQISISVETPSGTSEEKTLEITENINETLSEFDDVIDVNYVTVSSGNAQAAVMSGSSAASYTVQLVEQNEREKTTSEVVQQLDEELASIVGADVTVSEMSSGGMSLGDPIQIQLSGPENDVLEELTDEVITAISDVEGIYNPSSSISDTQSEMNIHVDREKAAQFGLSYQEVMSQVQTSFTGQTVMQYREEGDEMNVRLIRPEEQRSTITDLRNLMIQNQQGSQIALSAVADLEQVQTPATITRQNQQRQVNISSEISGRDLGSVMSDVDETLSSMHFPEEYNYSFGGQAQDMNEAFADLSLALLLSIFLVYAVMAIQFENFLFPFIIMFSMPATIVGVLGGLFVTGKPLSITAFIGVIMLAGIVVNNAIVLVDYINILRRRGIDRHEAIIEAGKTRLRPILMTTLTTILAMVPLALGFGEGAEMQQPMAITVIFGLGVSSIFTLVLIPVIYTYFDNLSERVKGWFSGKKRKKKVE
ncbi:acriflavin resistance protein family transporter subunit AcrB [Gracilibacillus halophilus YIM-C55.5]|uniref:Acriflavin resistance protein family transporter subunit AcrB n=1 Tax=Gracilibacillus halophilus YIM-C55.5 TaxID=1308866 RepID=N4WQ56_9BACI|nr:efflux RND transporter permease subunit [Gracilibacillus halophilus]ENH96575.1 acriflavin resistance protein family transporter subunit AcrB [Gracilibacillus halophilus YIM-C55.5]